MPEASEILKGLYAIANNYALIAIIWHFVFYLLIIFLFFKWKPSNRLLSSVLSLPLLSVAIVAFLSGNVFNGAIFSLLWILLIIFGLRTSKDQIILSSLPYKITGFAMIIFGLVYPHFLNAGSVFQYLYSSPAGIIPCPTLSVVIGFALLYNGFNSRSFIITLISAGLFYSIFGIIKLEVYLDIFLLSGTVALLIKEGKRRIE